MKTFLSLLLWLAAVGSVKAASFVVPPVGSGGVNGGLSNAYGFSAGFSVANFTNVSMLPAISNLALNLPGTNATIAGRGAVGTLSGGVLTLSNTAAIYTNVIYVNANGSPTANGTAYTNAVKNAPANSLVVIGAGEYYVPLNSHANLKHLVDQQWLPGSVFRVGDGTIPGTVSANFYDLNGAVTCNIYGFGQFSNTNENGLVLYVSANGTKVTFECDSTVNKGFGGSAWSKDGGIQAEVTFRARKSMISYDYDAFFFGPFAGDKLKTYCPYVYSGQEIFEITGAAAAWGDVVIDIDSAESSSTTAFIQMGSRCIARVGYLKVTGNSVMYMNGATNGLIHDSIIEIPTNSSRAVISQDAFTGNTHFWLRNVTLRGSYDATPINLTNAAGTQLILENSSIEGGPVNSIGTASTPQTIVIKGMLSRKMPIAANVAISAANTEEIGSASLNVGLSLPTLVTSRVLFSDANGNMTNVSSGSPSTEYVKADGTTGTPAGGSVGPGSLDHNSNQFNTNGNVSLKSGALTTNLSIRAGLALPSLTASRVVYVDANGNATNVTSAAASTDYVHADGSVGTPSGSGDVFGPASVTDQQVAIFGGTSGDRLTNSPVTINPVTGAMAGVGSLSVTGSVTTGQAGSGPGTISILETNGFSGVRLTVPTRVSGPTNELKFDLPVLQAGQRFKVHSISGQTATVTGITERAYLQLTHPHSFDGVGARLTNLVTDPFFGQALFANGADKSTNYVEYRVTVPEDIDTNQPVIVERLKFRLSATDTGAHRYVLSTVVQADSAAYAGSPSTEINADFAGDGSGAAGDVETVSSVTLTGWPGQLVAGRLWVIRLARDGDTSDASTVDSFSGPLTISYGKQ